MNFSSVSAVRLSPTIVVARSVLDIPVEICTLFCNAIDVLIDRHLGPDDLSQREPNPYEDESNRKEWVDSILSLGIWVDTWKHTQAFKVQSTAYLSTSTRPSHQLSGRCH